MPSRNKNSRDHWGAQLRKGTLDLAALASVWRKPLYGLEIIRHLEMHSQLTLAEGTLYPILNRLKVEGLLSSEWVETVVWDLEIRIDCIA